jgi:uncharacterized protein (TIRG00374 family)
MRSYIKLVLKVCFSILLLWGPLQKHNLANIFIHILSANYFSIIFALLIFAFGIFVGGLRWQIILTGLGFECSFKNINNLNWIGVFFNQVLPTGIGGDVVRSWYAHKLHIPFGKAISSVIIDKLFGLISLTVVCLFGAGWFQLERIYFSVLIFLLIQLSAFLFLYIFPIIKFKLFGYFLELFQKLHVMTISSSFKYIVLNRVALMQIILSSLLCQLAAIFGTYIISCSIGAKISLLSFFLVVPLANLGSVIPISIAGWGVRENIFVGLFSLLDIQADDPLTVSLIYGILHLFLAAPGVFFWLKAKSTYH